MESSLLLLDRGIVSDKLPSAHRATCKHIQGFATVCTCHHVSTKPAFHLKFCHHLCPSGQPYTQLFDVPADVDRRSLGRGRVLNVCLPSVPSPQTISLQQSLVWKQEHYFFWWRMGSREEEMWKGESQGMGNPQTVVHFQEAARLDLSEQVTFFQDAFSLRSPTPDTPVPSFQPRPLHHRQRGKEPGMVAVTALLDKFYRNLHKPQRSRCRGRLEETCFSVGFSLVSAANGS